jgi:hypothetical protein
MKKNLLMIIVTLCVLGFAQIGYGHPPTYWNHTQVVDYDIDEDGTFGLLTDIIICGSLVGTGEPGCYCNDGWCDNVDRPYYGCGDAVTESCTFRGDMICEPECDINGNGVVDQDDYDKMVDSWFNAGGDIYLCDYTFYAGEVYTTQDYEGENFNIYSMDESALDEYVDYWIHVKHYEHKPGYVCHHFDMDTATACYRDLGYGTVMDACSSFHGYNIFWIGGDIHDLHNWIIVEPQTGYMRNAGDNDLPDRYQTYWIFFYKCKDKFGNGRGTAFRVDYANKYVDIDNPILGSASITGLREPFPSSFNYNWEGLCR